MIQLPKEGISREELDTLPPSEINDDFVLDLASREFDVSVWQVIYSAQAAEHRIVHDSHVENIYQGFWRYHRVPERVRRHAIDALLGRVPLTTSNDPDNPQAVLKC